MFKMRGTVIFHVGDLIQRLIILMRKSSLSFSYLLLFENAQGWQRGRYFKWLPYIFRQLRAFQLERICCFPITYSILSSLLSCIVELYGHASLCLKIGRELGALILHYKTKYDLVDTGTLTFWPDLYVNKILNS